MTDSDLMFRGAIELAGMVRRGEISARELVQVSLDRIEEINPRLNAFVDVDAERALASAAQIGAGDQRPFAGVPIAIKNNRPVSGLRTTIGSQLLVENVSHHDAHVTSRFKQAGFVIVGTTTLPEFGILPVSEARMFGPTRNPWDLDRTPGGSSGGAAAAVASGMVPIAHGNDGGGSIRIPAACCGLVGLKPARGRISAAPERGEAPLDVDGVLTHTVADTAAVLDVLAGYELGDITWAPPPAESFASAASRESSRLRIAVASKPPLADATIDPLCLRAVDDTAGLLRSLGHDVLEIDPPWQIDGLSELFGGVFSIHIATQILYAGMVAGRELSDQDMEPMSWAIYQMTKQIDSVHGIAMEIQLQALTRQLIQFLAPYDALLTPALAERPLPLGTLDTAAPDPMATFTRSGYFTPFTPIVNASGQPAISLPLYEREDGLPLAVQLIGRPADEATLLGLARQLEIAAPWAGRRAPVS